MPRAESGGSSARPWRGCTKAKSGRASCCAPSSRLRRPSSLPIATARSSTSNPRFSEITGYGAAETIGRNPRFLKSGETPPDVYRELWATITAGDTWRGELVNRGKNGELLWMQASISALLDGDGTITNYVAVEEDVTERKRAEGVLEETQQRLVQAQKMEAIGRLAGGVAHDFNNLLTVIGGYGELLASDLSAADPRRAEVEAILGAARRAADLTRQLLAFSRRQVLQPKRIDVGAVLAEMQSMLQRLIGEDVELVVRVAEKLGAVKVDVGQFEQVIMNLVVNSRDAMPAGGTLVVDAVNRDLDATTLVRGEPHPGAWVLIRVSDSGEGMDAEVLARVFEPFFTTKPAGLGTGLGLAMVYGIVTQSGGFIDVQSERGQGSTFGVYLPLANGVDLAEAPAPGAVEELRGTETLLLVEDQDALRELLCRALRQLGYRVLEAASGAAALVVLGELEVDLLVTDVVMPGLSGRELADRVVAFHPGVGVLFMSGYTSDVLGRHGVLDPGVHLIQKPFTSRELAVRVREVLALR